MRVQNILHTLALSSKIQIPASKNALKYDFTPSAIVHLVAPRQNRERDKDRSL